MARVVRRRRRTKRGLAALAVLVVGALAACGEEDGPASPKPQPAFYMTAAIAADLKRQAYDAGSRFAKDQGPDEALLVLDFGAARLKGKTYGAALRGGTFFSNEQIGAALQAAARGHRDGYRQGSVTIVYVNSNAFLGRPGTGYEPFDEQIAREAGEQQAETIGEVRLFSHQSAAVGGDIEPGYDAVSKPEVSIALVAGAAAASDGGPYYNFGTAPCTDGKCTNGWTVEDICEVSSGGGRQPVPEVYLEGTIDQAAQWAEVAKRCEIDSFAGVSASPAGDLSPEESHRALQERTEADVEPIIVVFPE